MPLGTDFRWLRATDVGHQGRRIASAAYCLSLPPSTESKVRHAEVSCSARCDC